MLAIGQAAILALVESLDSLRQLDSRPAVRLFGFEDARPEEFGDVLKLVRGKAKKELARFAFVRIGNYRTEGPNQGRFHRC